MDQLVYTDDFAVRTYDLDSHRRLSLPALVRLMQEAAMQHVLQLKISVWDLESRGLSWVLLRKHLWLKRLPGLGERLHITTYPAGFDRLFTYRDYLVENEVGERLAWSSSTWALMDTTTRQMARIPGFIQDFEGRMLASEHWLPRPVNKLTPPTATEFGRTFRVGYYDLDFNSHLNNAVYLRWLLEALPAEILRAEPPSELTIHYRLEAQLDTEVMASAMAAPEGNGYLHQLTRQEDGRELALLRTWWR